MPEMNAARYRAMARDYLEKPPAPRLQALALALYQKALALEPEDIDTHLSLAVATHRLGQTQEALACCDRALQIQPDSFKIRLVRCMLNIPYLYADDRQIAASREDYRRDLEALAQSVDGEEAPSVAQAAKAIGLRQPFFLAFQALDDLDLQRRYGDLVCRLLAERYPEWSRPLEAPARQAGERIRVGFASTKFYQHSVWKLNIKGWISQLDRQRFELYGYDLGDRRDQENEFARQQFEHWWKGLPSEADWRQQIYNDRLHVLIYPEIGMSRMTLRLAGTRLAPVQCQSWGHSITSGLPTIDYYLSSELIEPENGPAHYREKLVRLPNLSIYYDLAPLEATPTPRQEFGIREDAVVYFCGQTMFKYLPQYDVVFPQIARQVANCQFVFRRYAQSYPVTQQFEKRLAVAFAAYDLDWQDYVVMQPWLPNEKYQRLHQLVDVFLDTIGWSGGTSTLESLAFDLPVVTFPGPYFRTRTSYGILKRMGVLETVADSLEEYVQIAARLGNEPSWRAEVAAKMHDNKAKVYCDQEAMRGLERFLESVAP